MAAYFALLFALPVLLYEVYAFVIPALNPDERRVAIPLMVVAPLLFMAGVVFAYFVVLPPAVRFLQGYNSEQLRHPRPGQDLLHVRDPHDARRSAWPSSCRSALLGLHRVGRDQRSAP